MQLDLTETIDAPIINVDGTPGTLRIPKALVDAFFSFILNTGHWRYEPQLIGDRAMKFRKQAFEFGKKIAPAVVVVVDAEPEPAPLQSGKKHRAAA